MLGRVARKGSGGLGPGVHRYFRLIRFVVEVKFGTIGAHLHRDRHRPDDTRDGAKKGPANLTPCVCSACQPVPACTPGRRSSTCCTMQSKRQRRGESTPPRLSSAFAALPVVYTKWFLVGHIADFSTKALGRP